MVVRILNEDKKYEGKYVAFRSFADSTVVAEGAKPDKVREKAIQEGTPHPVIAFIPEEGVGTIH